MTIDRKDSPQKRETGGFIFGMGLRHHIFSDYACLKILSQSEGWSLMPTYAAIAIELVEKSFKLYLSFKERRNDALSYYSKKFGHNLEKLRQKSEYYNPIFSDERFKKITEPFNDRSGRFFQFIRYGSQETIDGYKINWSEVVPMWSVWF